MKPSEALNKHRIAIRQVVEASRAQNPRVFGSVLHGKDGAASDLDLLVDTLHETTLFDLGGLQEDLEALLGIQVDLLTPADISAKFLDKVLAEAQPV
ncbi:nucleotidyltransferase family protein [Methylobacillus pratensis]